MKKLFYIIIGCTGLWYLSLYFLLSDMMCPQGCVVLPENTRLGFNWPSLLPSCGTCGIPRSFSNFALQLFVILLPAILILFGYGIYKAIRKNRNNESKINPEN